ncbi:polysaccharide biosynthesis protein [Mobilitalea sibirica]|uniref:Polysaccharide biosynthesis protein n=1 Tax=Mobilitalea sibirica TaxID=1462919 RepID=A0A8J7H080_9FIRM|nr:nucleoside-diphosphate sugar epimerase/dehydratase [Mobilitalea sibirica]MBH1939404.1 polysaccharide biosynthesis protein [Mobilitalea sibirica]
MLIKKYRKTIVFLLDLFIIVFVNIVLYYFLQLINERVCLNAFELLPHMVIMTLCGAITQSLFRTYDSLWRYAESKEYITLILGGACGYVCFFTLNYFIPGSKLSVLFTLASYSVSLLGMLFMRLCYRQYRKCNKYKKYKDRISLAIIGAGEAGVKLLEEVQNNPNSRYETVCFIDDSIEKIGKFIRNIEVKGPIAKMEKILGDCLVREIVIAIPSATPKQLKCILEICSKIKCRVRILPDTMTLLHRSKSNLWNNIREIQIEELIGREQVILDDKQIKDFILQKVVMVTGGGGSIGSELCRQIARYEPKQLILVDNYENNAYEIQQELLQAYHSNLNLKVEIASVRDGHKVNELLKRYKPNLIFHAAAHKHVPLMEDCPEEAVKNNILGTYNMVLAADRYKVDKFIHISTDKAVNPTSIMGASKRFCEMILQSMKNNSKTDYIAVRFGNVLGSNGSVIPLFQKQIAAGGPVTVTDRRIYRYFMTIAEAVQLVLVSGSMKGNAEIYVLDMGRAVNILELAENLIRLSGYTPYEEIPIIEKGIRPGEKLYEEPLTKGEELIATSNRKIFIERQKSITKKELEDKLELLNNALKTGAPDHIKEVMKQVVPTYRDPKEVNESNVDYDYGAILEQIDGGNNESE